MQFNLFVPKLMYDIKCSSAKIIICQWLKFFSMIIFRSLIKFVRFCPFGNYLMLLCPLQYLNLSASHLSSYPFCLYFIIFELRRLPQVAQTYPNSGS